MSYDYSKKPEPTSYQKQNTPVVEKKLSFFGRVYGFFTGKSKISEAQIFSKATQREQSSEKPTLSELKDRLGDLTDKAARIRGTMKETQNTRNKLETQIALTKREKYDNIKARDSAKDLIPVQKLKNNTESLERAMKTAELDLKNLLSTNTTIQMVADKQGEIEEAKIYLNHWQAQLEIEAPKGNKVQSLKIQNSINVVKETLNNRELAIKTLLKPSVSIDDFQKAFSKYNKSVEACNEHKERLTRVQSNLNQPKNRSVNNPLQQIKSIIHPNESTTQDTRDHELDFIQASVGVEQKEFEISVLIDKLAEPKRRLDELKTQLASVERLIAKTNKEIELLEKEPTVTQPSSRYPLSNHQITTQETHDSLWQWLLSKFQWR